MDLLCLDIENLQDGDKIAAVKHFEDSLRVIKLGSSLVFQQQSQAKGEKVDIDEDEAQSIEMKTEENKVRRKFQNLYNGLVPTCEKCGDTFPTLATLDIHIKRNHETKDVSTTKVETTKTEITKETRENSPRNSKTENDERKLTKCPKSAKPLDERFQCEVCDKSFGKRDSLLQHRICHTRKYECERCKHGFSEQRKLSKHLMNKENCQKYLVKKDAVDHMSSVKTTKNLLEYQIIDKKIEKNTEGFKCFPCDIAFSKQYNLSRHQKKESHKLKTSLIEA